VVYDNERVFTFAIASPTATVAIHYYDYSSGHTHVGEGELEGNLTKKVDSASNKVIYDIKSNYYEWTISMDSSNTKLYATMLPYYSEQVFARE
jgi:hypothetical protein